ncbi:MAG: 3-phosphoshikimate 1-carboxyvinyltransferase, partial [Gemmatimonadetes bacterium]|nr:3-phosphoshikimate 1-carboxyvinyltransferase [Gemmatimonadota bacterium]NIQ52266.1 3-phosphoshikimate 1-carboxyvinyltransferase [Gemmatimonadota bacterium]NIU75990.1 3-phosphoshikimate 1-carboxyvinyltransferase [Gammaproteobacteria bacterium]NIX39374.1 3-phosphoshikimate 1-carboxyvinyltransferase [Gemmatimonadota bacterium]NIX46375.1 3-phosphoshikimate 1-carboxyvinyltransferase [Gemmatimonadota bacterium]
EPLERMGAQIEELGEPDRLPLRITGGRLRGITYESPSASAQVKSAVLLAGLIGGVPVRAREPYLSRDHTERMLRAMGAHVFARTVDGRPEAVLEPVSTLQPLDLTVPGDFSSAAFFAVLG